ncbi:unnamed protein product [Calypogeia fissa]
MVASRFYGSIFSSTYYTYCSFITAIASRFYFCWKHWQFYATETKNCSFLLLTTKQAVSLNLVCSSLSKAINLRLPSSSHAVACVFGQSYFSCGPLQTTANFWEHVVAGQWRRPSGRTFSPLWGHKSECFLGVSSNMVSTHSTTA